MINFTTAELEGIFVALIVLFMAAVTAATWQ